MYPSLSTREKQTTKKQTPLHCEHFFLMTLHTFGAFECMRLHTVTHDFTTIRAERHCSETCNPCGHVLVSTEFNALPVFTLLLDRSQKRSTKSRDITDLNQLPL